MPVPTNYSNELATMTADSTSNLEEGSINNNVNDNSDSAGINDKSNNANNVPDHK